MQGKDGEVLIRFQMKTEHCERGLKAGFHLCACCRADRATVRRQSREPGARLRDQGPEHAY